MAPSVPPPPSSGIRLRRLLWRIHFWVGLITAPIVLFAAATGLVYVVSPQVEAWRHAPLDHVPVRPAQHSLDAQVAAARAALPDHDVQYVVPAFAPGETTRVHLRPQAHEHHADGQHSHGQPEGAVAYVDPYTATVVGRLGEMQRFKAWARKLHSNLLQGEGWRWIIELGASWMLVMFATGLVLWWPRPSAEGGRGWRALRPQWGGGRATWRDLHALVAIALGLVLAVVLVTGLTWSRHGGANFRLLQQALDQQAPRPPAGARSTPRPGQPPLTWQQAWEHAAAHAPAVSMMLTAPQGADGTWRAENFDRSQPTRRFVLLLDAYGGQPVFSTGWAQMPVLARATAVGIPFHRGEFGIWNQAVLALAALAAVFSVVSGLRMWWLRRPGSGFGAPEAEASHWRSAPAWLWPAALVLGLALPVWGVSVLLLAAVEAGRLAVTAARSGAATAAGLDG
jgi:uncharacterized iron-regulated membrane protein